MINRTEQPSRGRAHRVVPFGVFALLSLCLPVAAMAQWVTSGTTVTNQGRVGIGVAAPQAPLHVDGMPLSTGPQAG